ncbi:MAG: FAD-dependent monooxygenase [Rhodoferax sp.]|nr:FAD-dependent monooxygenase [Rhodoferax sp.]
MMKKFDICVRGTGIVGRSLALLLAGKRLRVAMVQPPHVTAPSGHHDVRAYALHARSRALLESVRCWPDDTSATPVVSMEVHGDRDGHVRFSAHEQGIEALNWIVDVPALETLLTDAVRFQPLITIVEAPVDAALTVVCEGKASRTRDALGVEFDVAAYEQTALAARVQCETPHGQVARQWFSKEGVLAFLPLDGAAGNRCAVVWSVTPERAAELQHCDAPAFARQLQEASHGTLGALVLCSDRVVWPLQLAQARHWCGQRADGAWVLAGDAAHTVHPLAGQGLNLGLGDVEELVTLLDTRPYWRGVDDVRLLRQYERARKAELAMVGGSTDALQRLFDRPDALLQNIRNWGMQQFDRSGPLKHWVTSRAMGGGTPPASTPFPTRN